MGGVDEDVAFRMPALILRCADHGGDFRKMREPAAIAQKGEPEGWARTFHGPLAPFVPDSILGEFADGAGDRATEFQSFRRGAKLEAPGKLEAAQDTQRIFNERGARVAKNSLAQILFAAMQINH